MFLAVFYIFSVIAYIYNVYKLQMIMNWLNVNNPLTKPSLLVQTIVLPPFRFLFHWQYVDVELQFIP